MQKRPFHPVPLTWTYDDYRELPDDGKRYEIIDGELYVTPAPLTSHQKISRRLQFEFMLQIEKKKLGVVYNAPVDLILSETLTVQPDLLVIRAENIKFITPRGIETAPDLIVEILSPSTARRDRMLKLKTYARESVLEYWIVDPEMQSIEVLTLSDGGYVRHGLFGGGERLSSTIFELVIEVDPIFAPEI